MVEVPVRVDDRRDRRAPRGSEIKRRLRVLGMATPLDDDQAARAYEITLLPSGLLPGSKVPRCR